jgi:hypothetical protein
LKLPADRIRYTVSQWSLASYDGERREPECGFSIECAAEEGQLIAFGQAIESFPHLSDAEFFSSVAWEKSAPAKLLRAAKSDDLERVIRLVVEAAGGSRARRMGVRESDREKQSLWSRHHLEESPRAARLIRAWDGLGRNGLRRSDKRAEANGAGRQNGSGRENGQSPRGGETSFAAQVVRGRTTADRWAQMCAEGPPLSLLETLVLFEMLRDAGRRVPAALAAKFWRMALTAAIQITDGEPSASTAAESGLGDRSRFVQAELAWQAGLLFAPVLGAERIAASARTVLCEMLLTSTDSAGVPSAEMVAELPVWLATLVRGREWGRQFGRLLFGVPQEKRFRALVGAISRLCRGDGRTAFSNGTANGLQGVWSAAATAVPDRNRASSPAIQYLLSLSADPPRRPLQGRMKNGRPSPASNGVVRRKRVTPVFQSDNSHLACLRSDWTREANSLPVLHHGRFPVLELAARGSVLLSGDWEIEIRVAGEAIAFDGPWSCSCWYSDDEGDYLELQARPTAEIRIERQLLLARNDDLLFLADAVIGCGEARIDYVSRLSPVPGVEIVPDAPTRECRLAGKAVHARIFPLGLPCERVLGCAGQLAPAIAHLELRQTGIGGLYAPLVIDWNPARRRSAASWRPLTVAQNGAVVSPRAAAGCRLQIGSAQWLVYRSLSSILEPRTVLGQHTMYETLIGRFVPSGEVEPIVLVEQRAEGA